MSILELIEQLKAMPEKMEGYNSEGELVVLNTHKLADSLKKSLRNCDVGTVDEQRDRLESFCAIHFRYSADNPCSGCPAYNGDSRPCVYRFLQMPYEEASEMKDYSNVRAVCFACARRAGFVQKKKAVIVFEDECGICKARRPCTDLRNDWIQPKEESEVE